MRIALAIAGVLVAAAGTPVAAQIRPSATIELPPANRLTIEGPTVGINGLFGDRRSRELLASNFPARISVSVELWESGFWFDNVIAATHWEFVVQSDPLTNVYRVSRVETDSLVPVSSYPTVDELVAALSEPRRARVSAPAGRDDLYYTVSVSVETLTSNDLAELQRWLSGDVRPALEGRRNPVSVVTRGVRTMLSRFLGGDSKRFGATSATFDT